MLYLEICDTNGGTFEDIEIDQYQAEILSNSLDGLDSGIPQIKRLKEFVRAIKQRADQEAAQLRSDIAIREQQLKNLTFRP